MSNQPVYQGLAFANPPNQKKLQRDVMVQQLNQECGETFVPKMMHMMNSSDPFDFKYEEKTSAAKRKEDMLVWSSIGLLLMVFV